jgi:fibro-slime domain-containing protein
MKSRTCLAASIFVILSGCNTDPTISGSGGDGAGGSGVKPPVNPPMTPPSGGGGTGAGGAGSMPMTGFTPGQIGGYKLGDPVTNDMPGDGNCDYLLAVVRDFQGANQQGGHPDFESFSGNDATKGLVAAMLGADRKPVYASMCEAGVGGGGGGNGRGNRGGQGGPCPYGQQTTSKDAFDQWYRLADGVNKPYLLYLLFKRMGGIATFNSQHYFPLDNAGWGSLAYADDFKQHNFGFTTELHTKFTYNGGETFQFEGDDDVWVFINRKLAIDLGGLHPPTKAMVNLDTSAAALGLTRGNVYLLELFHAERHTTSSRFSVDTTLTFVDCGIISPDVP